ncbi:MAG TPA: tetratricopeptide repeat protein, partial [Thiotrichales bacterium]|nr:tetratricopeptide repeat protein [Thiotrichales bacterium]
MDRQSSLFLLHGRVFLLAFVLCLCPPTLSAADSGDWEQWLDRAAAEAGDPDFDMAFGLAALEFGHPEQAVFAFERVLMIRPWDHRARLELGRAQLANGNFAAARESFQTVLDAQPPETVARN